VKGRRVEHVLGVVVAMLLLTSTAFAAAQPDLPRRRQLLRAPSSITINTKYLHGLVGQPPLRGNVTIKILAVERVTEVPPPEYDDAADPKRPRGIFYAVRYSLTNDASVDVSFSQVSPEMRLADGTRSWIEDGNGVVSGTFAVQRGDDDPDGSVGPGFTFTTWTLYDIPPTAKPAGLAFQLYRYTKEGLFLPARYRAIGLPD
jgi:hypothetical protein